jgi:hypothetical protein
MNERFKELYSQASEYAISQLLHENEHAGRSLAEVANERFAELIVEECVEIVMADKVISWADSIRIKQLIEENFEVKS